MRNGNVLQLKVGNGQMINIIKSDNTHTRLICRKGRSDLHLGRRLSEESGVALLNYVNKLTAKMQDKEFKAKFVVNGEIFHITLESEAGKHNFSRHISEFMV